MGSVTRGSSGGGIAHEANSLVAGVAGGLRFFAMAASAPAMGLTPVMYMRSCRVPIHNRVKQDSTQMARNTSLNASTFGLASHLLRQQCCALRRAQRGIGDDAAIRAAQCLQDELRLAGP